MNKIALKLGGTIMVLFLVVLLPLEYVANQVQEEIGELSKNMLGQLHRLKMKKSLICLKRWMI